MLGLKLQHRGKTISANIKNGVISISQYEDSLSFGGLDIEKNIHLDWYKEKIKEGEKVKITVVQTEEYPEPIRTSSAGKDNTEMRLQDFYGLENYLKREGIIE